ncbi:hypothetical protein NKH47_01860 [Mesorhizobium sp. M1060]|uniref:hypothetical protein n=1 Tax=Mesorhizobium sp. M1060 TaxID=2957052 RepID=UPI0033399953
MADDFAGMTDQELLQARTSYEQTLKTIKDAIDNFDKAPLPANRLARDKLKESHNRMWEKTESGLAELEELVRLRATEE